LPLCEHPDTLGLLFPEEQVHCHRNALIAFAKAAPYLARQIRIERDAPRRSTTTAVYIPAGRPVRLIVRPSMPACSLIAARPPASTMTSSE
jgi:hypothetical protein